MSSGTTKTRSLRMLDANGQKLAEFLIIDERVISIPSFCLMHLIENDYSQALARAMPGRRWQLDYFVRYLIDVCAQYKNDPFPPMIESANDGYVGFNLDGHVDCRALADLVGVMDERVRGILRNHLTFPDQHICP